MLKNYFFKTRNFFLLICMILVAQNGFAQEAADYKLTVTTTPSTCEQNGSIIMDVTKANGDPLDMTVIDNVYYCVVEAGAAAPTHDKYTVTPTVHQLLPGNYDVYVKIVHKTADEVLLTQQNINIANEYIALAETGFYAFRELYTLNCVPTGAVRISVMGKPNGKYGIRFTKSPTSYTGLTDVANLPINASGTSSYTFEKLSAGYYEYQVYNECGALATKNFTIRNFTKTDGSIASDLPILNSNVPYGLVIDNTCSGIASIELYGPNRRTGVFSNTTNRFESSALYRHHYSYDQAGPLNFYNFFEYATVTREEVKKLDDGLITEDKFNWRQGGELGRPGSFDRTYLLHRFSSPYPTYAQLRDPTYEKTPVRLYVRVKGSTDCYSYINLAIPQKNYHHQLSLSQATWDCQSYKTTVTSTSNTSTVCKREFSLYEIDANGTQVGDVLLTKTDVSGGRSIPFGVHSLDPNKKYRVKVVVTDYEGVVREEFIDLKPPATEYLMRSIIEAYVNISNCPWDENTPTANMMLGYSSQEKLDKMKITLLEAPAGYDATQTPRPGYKMLGLNESYTIPDGSWVNRFYPFAFNETTGKSEYNDYVVLPEGDYKFRYESECAPGEMAEFTVPLRYPSKPKKNNELQVATEIACDHIKVYPFRNQIIDYNIDGNGNPTALRFKFSGHMSTSTGSSEFFFNPQNINQPNVQNFYLRVARTNNVVITVDYQINYTSQSQYWGRNYGVYPNVPMERGYNSSTGTCVFYTQQIEVPYEDLTYNKKTYYGYCCKDGATAKMGIEGANGVGPYTYVLKDMAGNVLETRNEVPAGTLAHFDFSGQNIALEYGMIIKDHGCPGKEIYETVHLVELGTSVINPYYRKICTSETPVSYNISPINGVDGVLAVGQMSYTWTIHDYNSNIEGLEANATPRDTVASGKLKLAQGVKTPQKAVYRVIPKFGDCLGDPFDITLIVSPCINYWQGGVDNLWNREDNWTENTVPKIDEDVEFATNENNPPFVGIPKSGPAVRDLHVPVGDAKKIGSLINRTDLATIIPAEASLTVNNSIIGSETQEQAHKLVVGAEADKANGTLIVTKGCGHDIYGTVQLYGKGVKGPKGEWTDNIDGSPTKGRTFYSEYEWQYFGVPVQSIVANPSFYGASIREYDEAYNGDNLQFYQKWHWLNNESKLTAFKGYSITQPTAKTYSIAGKFFFCDTTLTMTRQAALVTNADDSGYLQNKHYGLGQNLYGNSYTAAIDIREIGFPTSGEVEETVYLYNTGRFHDWADKGVLTTGDTPQLSAGNWFAIPKESAAIWDNQIPSMQGFMLKFLDDELKNGPGNPAKVKIPYATTAGELKVLTNSKPQLAPGKVTSQTTKQEPLSYLRVNLESASTRDALWLISQEGTTNRFDNGWDGRKYFGTPTAFIFTENKDGLMQVNADKTIDGSIISFYANADTEYELTMIKSNLGQYADLHLHDLVTKTSVSLDTDTTYYSFTGINQGNVEKRFVILNSSELNLKDGSISLLDAYLKYNELLIVSNLSGKEGEVGLYDTTGRRILSKEMPTGVIEIPVTLGKGIYIVNMQVEGSRETVKIVVK